MAICQEAVVWWRPKVRFEFLKNDVHVREGIAPQAQVSKGDTVGSKNWLIMKDLKLDQEARQKVAYIQPLAICCWLQRVVKMDIEIPVRRLETGTLGSAALALNIGMA